MFLLGLIHNGGHSWALESLLPCQVRPENSGDSLACRNVHLIERELDAGAGVCLVTAELQEGCQSPNPKTARNSLVLKVRKDLFIRCNLVSLGLGWGAGVWHGGASSGWADACCS